MAETVLLEYKQKIDGLTLEPSDGGVFEVFKNDEKIYSKDETGEFPDQDTIVSRLG